MAVWKTNFRYEHGGGSSIVNVPGDVPSANTLRAVAKEALQGGCNGLNLPTKGVVIGCGHYN